MYPVPRAPKIHSFGRHFSPNSDTDDSKVVVQNDTTDTLHLPAEIWVHIATFIPDDTLQNMLGVNGLFFDLAMDVRYREVSLKSISLATMKTIARLA
jgi:hypothetical protein